MKQRRAFTLIELLVVIAIIAILAAILFPVFASAKVAAKKTQSLSNIKQIGTSHMIYLSDYDDAFCMSEYALPGGAHFTWNDMIEPYMKAGDKWTDTATGITYVRGGGGIAVSPSFPGHPMPNPTNWEDAHRGTGSYGVHVAVFANNYDFQWDPAQVSPSLNQTAIENLADKIGMLEKGMNGNASPYPWFEDWQGMWIGSITTVPGDESKIFRDGDTSTTPGGDAYDPRHNTDCTGGNWGEGTVGAWECAASPRYRFSDTTPVLFLDGHAKAIKRGGIKWYANIFIPRRDLSNRWTYGWYETNAPY